MDLKLEMSLLLVLRGDLSFESFPRLVPFLDLCGAMHDCKLELSLLVTPCRLKFESFPLLHPIFSFCMQKFGLKSDEFELVFCSYAGGVYYPKG